MSRALVITMKNPVKGKVKTRLASTVGEALALDIYLALLTHTRQVACQVEAARYLFYSDFVDENDDWPSRFFLKKIQHGIDIGERMAHALENVLRQHDNAILVGCDIPGLSAAILELAFEKLSTHDFVVGPAEDGGYYLIGMKTFESSVFQGITWSTSSVFEKTVDRMKAIGKSCYLLPTLPDVDTEEDWVKLLIG